MDDFREMMRRHGWWMRGQEACLLAALLALVYGEMVAAFAALTLNALCLWRAACVRAAWHEKN